MVGHDGANLPSVAFQHYTSVRLCDCYNRRSKRKKNENSDTGDASQHGGLFAKPCSPSFQRLGLPSFSSSPLQTVSRSGRRLSRNRTSIQAGPHSSSIRTSSGVRQSVCRSSCRAWPLSASLSRSSLRCVLQLWAPVVGTVSPDPRRFVSATCVPLCEGVAKKGSHVLARGTVELLSPELPLWPP